MIGLSESQLNDFFDNDNDSSLFLPQQTSVILSVCGRLVLGFRNSPACQSPFLIPKLLDFLHFDRIFILYYDTTMVISVREYDIC